MNHVANPNDLINEKKAERLIKLKRLKSVSDISTESSREVDLIKW